MADEEEGGDQRKSQGQIIFKYYDDNLSWIVDNYISMEIIRFTICFYLFILIPCTGFGLYRWYWWSLMQNIWVPPNRIEPWY
jgi:hypothetical protein